MKAAIAVLIVITGAVFAAGELLKADGRHNIAYDYTLLGWALSGVTILLIVIHALHRKPKIRQPHQRIRRDVKRAFGIGWDSELNPLCPICGTPLVLSRDKLIYRIDGGVPLPLPEPHCFKCDKVLPLHDDDGNHLTFGEAKRLLSPQPKTEPPALPPPDHQADDPPRPLPADKPTHQPPEQEPDLEAIKRIDASVRLHSLRNSVPQGDIEEKYVVIYHQALTDIQEDTGRDLSRFYIPRSELRRQVTSAPGPRIGGRPRGKIKYTEERYCDRAILLIAIDGAIDSLKKDPSDLQTGNALQPSQLPQAKKETPEPQSQTSDAPHPPETKPKREGRRPPSEKLKTTYRLLKSFRNNLPKGELHTSDVDEYHGLLDALQTELDNDLSEYRIPQTAIKSREIPQSFSMDMFGNTSGDPYRIEHYVPADVFKRKLDALFSLLDEPVRIVPFPTGHDVLDDDKKAILRAFTHPDCYPSEAWLSTLLQMHPVRLKVHLADLIEHNYLTGNRFDEYYDRLYDLTDKANRFIVGQEWVN